MQACSYWASSRSAACATSRSSAIDGSPESSPDHSLPRPVLLAETAGQAWRLFRSRFTASVLVFFVPLLILGVSANRIIDSIDEQSTARSIVYLLLVVVAQQIAAGFGLAVCQLNFVDEVLGVETGFGSSIGEVLELATPVLLATVFSVLLVFIGGILLPIPLIPIVLSYMLMGPPVLMTVVLLEKKQFTGSPSRVRELMRGEWLRVPMYLLTFGLGAAIVHILVTGFSLATVAHGATTVDEVPVVGQLAVVLASTLMRSLMLPYLSAVFLVCYFDLRARKESFDHRALQTLRPPH